MNTQQRLASHPFITFISRSLPPITFPSLRFPAVFQVLELRTEFPEMTLNLELMDQMWNVLQKSDVVFPSTAATTTIIDPEPLKEVSNTTVTARTITAAATAAAATTTITVPILLHPTPQS